MKNPSRRGGQDEDRKRGRGDEEKKKRGGQEEEKRTPITLSSSTQHHYIYHQLWDASLDPVKTAGLDLSLGVGPGLETGGCHWDCC